MLGLFRQSYQVCLHVAGSGKSVLKSAVEPGIVGSSGVVAHKAGLGDVVHASRGRFPWIAQCLVRSCRVVQESDVFVHSLQRFVSLVRTSWLT